MKRRKKIEFSKMILLVVAICTVLIVAFVLVDVWKTGDNEPLVFIIPGVFAELATATGFYYKKAEAENKIKLSNPFINQVNDESQNKKEETV